MNQIKRVSAVAVLLALLFALVGCGKSEEVTVPNVRGMDPEAAYELLHKAGLRVSTSEAMDYRFRLVTTVVPVGIAGFPPDVQEQTPQPGSAVARDSVVEIATGGWILSGGILKCDPYPTTTPDLVGETLESLSQHESCFSLEAKLPPLKAANKPSLLDNYVVTAQFPTPGEQALPISASNPPGYATVTVEVRAAD